MQRKKTLRATDNGTGALFEYLKDYKRLKLTDACKKFIDLKKVDISIWVNQNGRWRHDTNAEQRLQRLKLKDKSVCESIVTQLYGLSREEYEKIRQSFDQEMWKSWAGIYQAINVNHGSNFALVVELPAKEAKIGAGGAAGLAGTAGLITGIAGTYLTNTLTTDLATQLEGQRTTLDAAHQTAIRKQKMELDAAHDFALKEQERKYALLNERFGPLQKDHAAARKELREHDAKCDEKMASRAESMAEEQAKSRRLQKENADLRQELDQLKAAVAEGSEKLTAEQEKCKKLEKDKDDCAAEHRRLQESNGRTLEAAQAAQKQAQTLRKALQSTKVPLNETNQVQTLQQENATIRQKYNELKAQYIKTSQKKKKIKEEYEALQLQHKELQEVTDNLRRQLL
jgi:myosin heavy subunit